MLTWLWQPGSLYEIRANWGLYWAGCGMVKIIIKQGGAERINQKYKYNININGGNTKMSLLIF